MQLSNLSLTNFKGMIMLRDEYGGEYSINPKGISSVTKLGSYGMRENKATRIDMINGGVYFTPTTYNALMAAIEKANKTEANINLVV
jgi:hypothetical protein